MQPDNSPHHLKPAAETASRRRLLVFGAIFSCGLMLLVVGIILLGVVFYEGYDTLNNPAGLTRWLVLRNDIHGLPTANTQADPNLLQKALRNLMDRGPSMDFILGGYAILVIALLYIYVMARICLAMLSRGGDLLIQAIRFWRDSEKDARD